MACWETIKCTGYLIAGESLMFMSLLAAYIGINGWYGILAGLAGGRPKAKAPAMAVICPCAALLLSKPLFEASLLFIRLAIVPV